MCSPGQMQKLKMFSVYVCAFVFVSDMILYSDKITHYLDSFTLEQYCVHPI